MMHLLSIVAVSSFIVLSVLAAPLPFDQELGRRQTYYGRGTWFRDGMGACGSYNSDSDSIVAISAQIYGTGANCNQWVAVTNTATKKVAYGMTRDECQSCGPSDLDMSIGLFQQLGDLNTGVLSISWNYMPVGWSPS